MSKIFEALQKLEQDQNTSPAVTPITDPGQVDLEAGFADVPDETSEVQEFPPVIIGDME